MDYPNIMQIVAMIKKQSDFDKLAFLIPIADTALSISKTMILVDSFDKGITLAIHL